MNEKTKAYVRQAKVRAQKVKHPKGYGTDKERSKKKIWHEVRCEIHGSSGKGDWTGRGKYLKVIAPTSRYEQKAQGCPICARIARR